MMSSFRFKMVNICILVLFVASVSGCAPKTYDFRQPLDITQYTMNKIPLKAGLYMTPEYTNYEYISYKSIHPLGKALKEGSIEVVKRIFEESILLSSLDEASVQHVDVVVVPTIESVDIITEIKLGSKTRILVEIKWVVQDQNENLIWVDTFKGESVVGTGTMWTINQNRTRALRLAAEEQFGNAQRGMSKSTWWEAVKKK